MVNKIKIFFIILSFCIIPTGYVFADFSPSDISNLQLWLDASQGATTDGTTPATDGQTVQQWNDQSGNVHNATQLTGGSQPTYKTNIFNGQPVIRFGGSQKMLTSSFLNSGFNTSFTFVIVGNKVDETFKIHSSNQANVLFTGRDSTGLNYNTTGLSDSSIAISLDDGTLLGIETFRYNGSAKRLMFHSEELARAKGEAATGNLGLSGALTIGDYSSGGFNYNGDIAEMFVFNGAVSDADLLSLHDYLAEKYFSTSASYFDDETRLPQVVFEGDSMTAGTGSTGGETYPKQAIDVLGATDWTYTNLATAGDTMSGINGQVATVDVLYSPLLRPNNVAVLWGGTNDLYGGSDATTVYNRIVSWHAGRRVQGFKTIALTILPRNDGPGGFEAARQAVNTSIRQNWATFADGLADVAADARIGDSGDELNATYFSDGVHMTNAGYAIIADDVADQINTLIDAADPTVSITAPSNAATVSGTTVAITANASDDTGVEGVQFKLDTNTNVGSEDTTSTYGVTWDSTGVADGSHSIIAVARDSVGNYATSTAVNITVDNTAPVLSAGLPSGEQAANTSSVNLSLSTDEAALCKYGTAANTAYAAIASSFSATSTTHSATISGLTNGQSYTYYIRCQDGAGNTNGSDHPISFSVANATTPQPSGGGGGGGSTPRPRAPEGGFTATVDVSASGKSLLHFGFGSDITTIAIATSTNFLPATYINATSTLEWPTIALQTLYVKYCNRYNKCTDPIAVQVGTLVSVPTPTPTFGFTFSRNLSLHMAGADVLQLQKYLNLNGFTLAQSGVGSLGQETTYFGLLTYKSLIKFQEANAASILTPNSLTKGTGYFGPSTRAFVNSH